MPLVKQVIPERFQQSPHAFAEIEALLDVAVTATRLNNGSPCSGHTSMFEVWPGDEPYVRQWFVLENGKALGINESPDGNWTFPVVDYPL